MIPAAETNPNRFLDLTSFLQQNFHKVWITRIRSSAHGTIRNIHFVEFLPACWASDSMRMMNINTVHDNLLKSCQKTKRDEGKHLHPLKNTYGAPRHHTPIIQQKNVSVKSADIFLEKPSYTHPPRFPEMIRSAIIRTVLASVFHDSILASKEISAFRTERGLAHGKPFPLDASDITDAPGNRFILLSSDTLRPAPYHFQVPVGFLPFRRRNGVYRSPLRLPYPEPRHFFHGFRHMFRIICYFLPNPTSCTSS